MACLPSSWVMSTISLASFATSRRWKATNDWKDFEHQITFDVRQPKTREFTMKRLRKFIADHPYVDVIRYTTGM